MGKEVLYIAYGETTASGAKSLFGGFFIGGKEKK